MPAMVRFDSSKVTPNLPDWRGKRLARPCRPGPELEQKRASVRCHRRSGHWCNYNRELWNDLSQRTV